VAQEVGIVSHSVEMLMLRYKDSCVYAYGCLETFLISEGFVIGVVETCCDPNCLARISRFVAGVSSPHPVAVGHFPCFIFVAKIMTRKERAQLQYQALNAVRSLQALRGLKQAGPRLALLSR